MDSSNSGSYQSSSGGADNIEEYDSRTQSISSFLNPSTTHLLQPTHRRPPSDASFFDPSSFSNNPNPLQDLASVWTATNRPLSDFTTFPTNPNPSFTMDPNTKTSRASDQLHQVTSKNPKKRTRASRRAPTTVLTTDTTNFRQMVQEFTGIPTAPFTSAPFSRRLDLFSRVGDGGTTAGSSYTLRPAAQKIQQQPPLLNSTANIIESGTSNDITTAAISSNYPLPPSGIQDFQKQPSTLLDLQNPMLSFQSLLQSTLPQQSVNLSGYSSSSKRWRGEDGKLESIEGHGGSKLNSGLENVVVSSRSGGDQVQGNEDSWICPSN